MKLGRSIAGAALAAAVLVLAPAAQAQPTTLRLRGAFVAEHTSSKGMEIFKAEAERLSGGSIEVEVIPGTAGVSGTRELLDDIRTQNVFGIWIAAGHMARFIPEISVLGFPYVFDNYDEVARAIKGPVGTAIAAKMAAKGFMSLGWLMFGAQNVMNSKRPLRTLDDFKGLKLRLFPDETHLATFRALGANPVALDLKDLYLALRQGDVDGMENSYSVIYNYKFYAYGRYLSDTAHVLDLIAFVINREAFMSLQPEQQKAIREAAAIAVAQQWKMMAAEDADALVKLKEKGMQFDPLSPQTRAALRQATAVVVEDARKRVGNELVDGILAARQSGRPARATTATTIAAPVGQGRISTKRN
jgi:tripartite ATP-independent transporter DctP family solute receptor